MGFENFYVYSAVSPKSGEEFSFLAPYVNTVCMNLFLEGMSKHLGEKQAFLVMDQAGWHKSKTLVLPHNIKIIYLPPYSPELNPVERLWQHIKNHVLKNKVYQTLSSLEDAVCEFINSLGKEDIISICSLNYMSSYF